jgi:hypothetical protein
MASLLESLPLPDQRPAILDDCNRLLDAEVARKKGMSGLAVKAGYKILKTFMGGKVRNAIDGLLDDFIAALEPFHERHLQATAGGSFGDHLKANQQAVAEALLRVTDERARGSKHTTLVRGYHKLRGTALRNVTEAVPGLAELFDRYYQS